MDVNVDVKELYEKYGYLIYGRCVRILRSKQEAWDAVQEVFMKLVQQYDSIRDKERVVSWIYTAATNHCFNELRRQKKFAREIDAENIAAESTTEQRRDAREIISHALRFHGRKVREAVYYTYVEELDQREIQKVTGQSPATTRRNLKKFKDSFPAFRKRYMS